MSLLGLLSTLTLLNYLEACEFALLDADKQDRIASEAYSEACAAMNLAADNLRIAEGTKRMWEREVEALALAVEAKRS